MTDILRGDDAPGKWYHGMVGGGWMTWRLPNGVSADDYEPGPEECVELVIDIGGDREQPDEARPTEIWTVVYNSDRIVSNYKDVSDTVDTVTGVESAADRAVEYMKEHPGNDATNEHNIAESE